MKKFYKTNAFFAVASVIMAVLIWAYVAYEVSPMHEVLVSNVSVKCTNVSELFEDGSMVLTGENSEILKGNSKIQVRLKGKRNVVCHVKEKNITCYLDMGSVKRAGTYSIKPSIDCEISGVDVVKIEPYKLRVKAENIEQKDIKVNIKTSGKLPDGYTLEDVKNHNETVKITGASSVISIVDRAEVLFDYNTISTKDSEKVCKIEFYDKNSRIIDSTNFKKTVENSKISFNLYTVKEVNVVLMPKYADEVNKNHYGKSVKLSVSGDGTQTKAGGLEMKVKLKGTFAALEKYSDSKRIVYTEDIDVSGIYTGKTFEKVKAAELANSVWYVDVPEVKVKATVEDNK
ncbi:MAG: hypothetical protein J6R68_07400 [Clostridia bacterium]|nr:hypothetical protein [Clostridia bacterium]MBO7289641.1 hypothetical protein [Clostridia bacterium]